MLQGEYLVEKSIALVWAKLSNYGAGELKILDTYLSRIDARRPESAKVTFTKAEYGELLGLGSKMRTSQLKACTAKLLGSVVSIDFPDGSGYDQYPLFHQAHAKQDKSGQVVVTIECHPELRAAFFHLAEQRYVKYQLKNTLSLKGKHAVRLYSMLMAKPYGWTVSVDELRDLLDAKEKTYAEFKHFKNLVLKKAIDEINEGTDMRVDVEYIKKGRRIVAVKFNVVILQPNSIPEPAPEPEFDEDMEERLDSILYPELKFSLEHEIPDPKDYLALMSSACGDEFSRAEVEVLYDAAASHVPYDASITTIEEKRLWVHDYIESKYKLMKASNVKNRFAWLRKAVSEDWE